MANEESPSFPAATPHGELEKVLENLYCIQGSYNMGMGIMIGRTMTIYKSKNDLVIFNSMRVSEELEEEILKLGTIKHVVRMADAHGLDDAYYVNKFKPTYWSLDALKPRNVAHDRTLSYSDLPVPGMEMVALENGKECAFWIPDHGGTLITCDIVQNVTEIPIHANWFGGKVHSWFGLMGECNCAPLPWKSMHGKGHKKVRETILSWNFENLFTGHGPPKVGGGVKELIAKHFDDSLGPL